MMTFVMWILHCKNNSPMSSLKLSLKDYTSKQIRLCLVYLGGVIHHKLPADTGEYLCDMLSTSACKVLIKNYNYVALIFVVMN